MKKTKQISGTSENSLSRRGFFKVAGTVAAGIGFAGCIKSENETPPFLSREDLAPDALPAGGYILVDTKKCQGCVSCMMACTLTHHGEMNLSLSRIQVMQNSFTPYPEDISIAQCRQCVAPACVESCPEGALHIDNANSNIRYVDADRCAGCQSCLEACQFTPARTIWNAVEDHAQKCDLCLNTPHFNEQGGVNGCQACVSVCPTGAIVFSDKIPVQEGDNGYAVNLRDEAWAAMGYPTD